MSEYEYKRDLADLWDIVSKMVQAPTQWNHGFYTGLLLAFSQNCKNADLQEIANATFWAA